MRRTVKKWRRNASHQPRTCTGYCRRTHLDLLYCTLTACTLGQLSLGISKKVGMKSKKSPSIAQNFFVHRRALHMYATLEIFRFLK